MRAPWQIIETVTTRDRKVDLLDGSSASFIVAPPGDGWVVVNYSRDRLTTWQRRRQVRPFGRSSRGGGGPSK